MPLTHIRTFRVRHYECDAYGHLNHANYLRYMQETAFDASAAAGYDFTRYQELGAIWLIRETDIEYLLPLRYDDRVEVKTWVEDFRRVRSRRAYEFRLAQSGTLAARASTDWAYLSRQDGRPVAIPEEMKTAFFPEGVPADALRRGRFPPAPPPPPGVFTMRRRVEWRDIDPMQHVNNATYLTYIEDCGMQVSAAHSWPLERMWGAGFGVVARRHRIEYLLPAVLDDELEIATWVYDVRAASVMRYYTITRSSDSAVLARAHTQWVWIDVASQKPIRIPQAFMTDFAANIAG